LLWGSVIDGPASRPRERLRPRPPPPPPVDSTSVARSLPLRNRCCSCRWHFLGIPHRTLAELAGWLADWLAGWLAGWAGLLAGWLASWQLAGWAGWLAGLAGWLAGGGGFTVYETHGSWSDSQQATASRRERERTS
jgi:hypothetical protein